ncbi:MAG: MBL fold metallo-hydrolase [Oscillospiraceae bacterium]|nr:MBL fold metallo-hydrolase [Oscillospiraceae bacterium]
MKLKWYGTATMLLEQNGTQLLFDPFLSLNDKLFKPPMDELSAVVNILVTHGHLDHIVDIPTILEHGNVTSTVYCTAKPMETLISKGVASERINKIAPDDVLNFGPYEVCVLKGKHIVFDRRLIMKTLINTRILSYWHNCIYMLRENRQCVEAAKRQSRRIAFVVQLWLIMGKL